MGRSYLAQSRLQAACDAGVLAARKRLGSAVVADGAIPADVADAGNRFFNLNYQSGAYGTENRSFDMTLEEDYSISGSASVDVPTTIMQIFGYTDLPLTVECEAKLNFSNTDIMMVLDTTGSMNQTNPGDTASKIDSLRAVVKNFTAQIDGSKKPGTRIRYGFLPYSTNVNVGYLLKSDWLVDEWTYHGRQAKETGQWETYDVYDTTYTTVSGSDSAIVEYTTTTCPTNTAVWTSLMHWFDADGTEHGRTQVNGDYMWCNVSSDGSTVTVNGTRYNNLVYDWVRRKTGTATREIYKWQYKPITYDVTFLKGATGDDTIVGGSIDVPMYGYPSPTPANLTAWFRGCVEERDTYEIDDYDDVDFTKALDLDLDLVPDPGDPKTQWRPMLNEISFEPEIWWNGSGTFKKSSAPTFNDYIMAEWAGLSACPSPAAKLSEMSADEVSDYVDSLEARGSTYHDIGMIWGGRLMSPTGIFADENADVDGRSTSRHMIFLTDGETAPLDLSYGTYGIEPLDERRWSQSSTLSLTEVVEKRFSVACQQVRNHNITVWIIGFGTTLNPIMTECAGPGHTFEAEDAAQLNDVFNKIAASIGDLRLGK